MCSLRIEKPKIKNTRQAVYVPLNQTKDYKVIWRKNKPLKLGIKDKDFKTELSKCRNTSGRLRCSCNRKKVCDSV